MPHPQICSDCLWIQGFSKLQYKIQRKYYTILLQMCFHWQALSSEVVVEMGSYWLPGLVIGVPGVEIASPHSVWLPYFLGL